MTARPGSRARGYRRSGTRPTGPAFATTPAAAIRPGNQATSTPTTTDARWGHFKPSRRGQCKPSFSSPGGAGLKLALCTGTRQMALSRRPSAPHRMTSERRSSHARLVPLLDRCGSLTPRAGSATICSPHRSVGSVSYGTIGVLGSLSRVATAARWAAGKGEPVAAVQRDLPTGSATGPPGRLARGSRLRMGAAPMAERGVATPAVAWLLEGLLLLWMQARRLATEITPGAHALLQEFVNFAEVHAPILALDNEKTRSFSGLPTRVVRWDVLAHEPDVIRRSPSLVEDEVL